MPIPQEALDLENRNVCKREGDDWEPTLAAAYAILKPLWDAGDRDRELGLHLLYLSWYGMIEPQHITGFEESVDVFHKLEAMFEKVHSHFESDIEQDAEMLYVVGLVAHMQWFMFTDREKWEAIGKQYRRLYRAIEPGGLDPAIFEGRGAYGDYFKMQSCCEGEGCY